MTEYNNKRNYEKCFLFIVSVVSSLISKFYQVSKLTVNVTGRKGEEGGGGT